MLYVVHWYADPGAVAETFKRFRKVGHNAPASVKIVKAVFTLHLHEGWAIVETDDPVEFGKSIQTYSDICEHEVYPVVDEEGLRAIIGS